MLCFFVGACSTFQAFRSPSTSYRDYVTSQLHVQRIFDRGQDVLVAKILAVTPRLLDEQKRFVPVEHDFYRTEKRQFVIAVSVSGREPVNLENWGLRFAGQKAVHVEEIADQEIVEREFFFAYPFYRVYMIDFPKESADEVELTSQNLEILSPRGSLVFHSNFFGATRAAAAVEAAHP